MCFNFNTIDLWSVRLEDVSVFYIGWGTIPGTTIRDVILSVEYSKIIILTMLVRKTFSKRGFKVLVALVYHLS